MRWNWVQELRDTNEIVTEHIETEKNLADMLTKCLGAPVRDARFTQMEKVALEIEDNNAVMVR